MEVFPQPDTPEVLAGSQFNNIDIHRIRGYPGFVTTLQDRPAGTACCSECGCRSHADALDHARLDAGAALLAALGDPVRLGIVSLLSKHERLCACDIGEAFPVGQPTISHHLRVLREAGLVDVVRRGHWAFYGLRREVLKQVVGQTVELL